MKLFNLHIRLFLVLLFCVFVSAISQIPDELSRRIQGKTKLKDIMFEVDSYYNFGRQENKVKDGDGNEKEFENDYLFWKRWEYLNGMRLDENGNITNFNKRLWDITNTDSRFQQYTQGTTTSYGNWYSLGPFSYTLSATGYNGGNGRVSCIAFHPTDPNTLYVGTPQGGAWKSSNGGSTWYNLTDGIPTTGISGIVINSSDPNIIYLLTGDGDGSTPGFVLSYGFCKPSIGVLKSTDGGLNWFKTTDFPGAVGNYYGFKLLQKPGDPNTLFAATTLGIMKTSNGGTSWSNVQSGQFSDIEFKPSDPTTMYAARLNSSVPFYKSTTSGDSWSTSGITGVPTNSNRIAIGVTANNSAYVYFLAGPNTLGSFVGLYLSTNSGSSFTLKTNSPNILGYPNNGDDSTDQANYDLGIEIAPTSASTVLTAGINIWKSTNFGATLTNRTQWNQPTAPGDYVHADVHNLAYNPLDGKLYSCSDGGVAVSSDNGENWTFISQGLQIMAFYHGDGLATDNNYFAGGAQDNGTNFRKTNTTQFTHIWGADGFDCAIDYTNPNILYFVANGALKLTTDGGNSGSDISPPGVGTFPTIALDPAVHTTIYCGSGSVYKSTTSGSAGSWVNTGAAGSRALVTCPSNNARLYASNGTTTYRTDNSGGIWTTISGNTNYPSGQVLTGMGVSPVTSSHVWAVFGGFSNGNKVIRSLDGGATWTPISGTLPNIPIFCVAIDNLENVYIGTDLGVFFRGSTMTDWVYFNNYLPKTPVSDLIINTTAGKIKAATFGRGLFEADLYSACTPDIILGTNVDGTLFFEASNSITSTSTVQGGEGSNTYYKSGNYITLNPGFIATAGTKFLGYLGTCGVGGIPTLPVIATDSGEYDIKHLNWSSQSHIQMEVNKERGIKTPIVNTDFSNLK